MKQRLIVFFIILAIGVLYILLSAPCQLYGPEVVYPGRPPAPWYCTNILFQILGVVLFFPQILLLGGAIVLDWVSIFSIFLAAILAIQILYLYGLASLIVFLSKKFKLSNKNGVKSIFS